MRTPSLSVAVGGVLLAAVLVPSAAADDLGVVIRTYDASGLAEAGRAAALAAATSILEDAGLAVSRLACDDIDAGATGHPCRRPLRASGYGGPP